MTDDLTDVEARLRAGVAPARDLLAGATRATPAARDLAALVALGADEAQAFLEALLGDRDVASAALEETLTRAAERLEQGAALDLVDLLGLARERGVVARRLLDKTAASAPAADDRAALLLARGLGLSPDDLARAGVRDAPAALARAAGASAAVPIACAPADVLARVAARRAAAARITAVQRETPDERLRCTYCHGHLSPRWTRRCAACLAPHHGDCALEFGRCAAPGCGEQRMLHPASGPAWWRAPADVALGSVIALALLAGAAGAVALSRRSGKTTTPAPPVPVTTRALPPVPPPPPVMVPGVTPIELDAVRALMAGTSPDWAAISSQLLVLEGRHPADLTTLRALREDCARELRDEQRYQRAIDVVDGRAADHYAWIVPLLRQIDPRSRVYADAQAYLQWIDADQKVREAQRAYEAGDDASAFKLLNEALQYEVLGPEARASVRTRRQSWGRVVTAFKRGMELCNNDMHLEAQEELQRVLQLEPSPANAYHRRALDLLQYIQQLQVHDLERTLSEGIDALTNAEHDVAYRHFGHVRSDPSRQARDLQRIQDAVVEANRSRRLLRQAQQDFRRDRQERFLEIYYVAKLLRRWLPAGEERADAEKLYQDVLKRMKVLQMISGEEEDELRSFNPGGGR